ncbi:MAG: hypothetical protein ACREOE_14470, partial [Gemmatimonadales bacterium]
MAMGMGMGHGGMGRMGGGGGAMWGLMRSFRRDEAVTQEKLPPGIFGRVLRFAAPYKKLLSVFLVLIVFDALISAANPLIYRAIINQGILGHRRNL